MEEQKVCPHCGQNVEKGEKFCANCGKPLNTAPHPVQQTIADKPKMSHKKRNILIGVAAALFVFFIIGSSGEEEPEPVVQTAEADTRRRSRRRRRAIRRLKFTLTLRIMNRCHTH